MSKVLVLYAHPAQQHSRINSDLAHAVGAIDTVTFVDLYARYPRFKIDVNVEQQRLLDHDAIVLQFPIYWYSTPSLLKEWLDLVLEYGFAYGPGGDKLAGKWLLLAVTTGGEQQAYSERGQNRFELRTLLSPLEQTAHLCQLRFLPPLALFAAHSAPLDGRGARYIGLYKSLISAMCRDTIDLASLQQHALLTEETIARLELD